MKYQTLKHQVALFASCCALFFILPSSPWHVIPMLIAAILAGLATYYDNPKIKLTQGLIFLILCYYSPNLFLFTPLMVYTLCNTLAPTFFIALAPFSVIMPHAISLKLAIGLGSFLALLLKIEVDRFQALRAKHLALSDTMRELNHNLGRKNKDLIAKQDDDIHMATLNERNRIAREIHDHVGHQITSALLQVGALLIHDRENEALLTVKATLTEAMNHIRRSVHNLYDTSIDLDAQISSLVKDFTLCEIGLNINYHTMPPNKMKFALVAILKEGLSNIIKHAAPTRVDLTLIEHPGFYQLILTNDGTTSSGSQLELERGIGLKNIEQRVESLNGRFLVKAKPGHEYTLFITLPKEAHP